MYGRFRGGHRLKISPKMVKIMEMARLSVKCENESCQTAIFRANRPLSYTHGEGGAPWPHPWGRQNGQNEGCYNLPQWTAKNNEKKLSLTDQIPSIATKISTGIRTNYDLAPSGLSGVSKRKKCEKKPNFRRFSKMRASVTYYFDSIMAYETHSFAYGMKKMI